MGEETGFHNRFPGNLDPEAQEFTPRNPTIQLYPFPPPPPTQVYYPYSPPPLYYPPPTDVQVVYHPQFHITPAADVCHTAAALQPPPPSSAVTRTVVLISVEGDVSETAVRREMEVYGEVRGVQMERVRDGIVTVHFYDLRHAERALREIREQHMQHGESYMGGGATSMRRRGIFSGRPVWAQFGIPASNAVSGGNNQGTLVVFNLDPEMSTHNLKKKFEAFGPVKEVRETPLKKHQRFIEFFDVRHAAKALREMNGKEIHGKQIVIEFSRPGGYSRKFQNAAMSASTPLNYHHPPPPPRRFSGRMASNLPPRCLSQTHSKKLNCVRENPNGSCSSSSKIKISSIEDSMGCLNLDESNGLSLKKHAKKSHNIGISNKQQQQQPRISRKGSKVKKLDSRFLINESAIVESHCRDSRTTVMIKNIPNKYSQKLLLNMLDNHCIHCNEQIAAEGGSDDDHGQPLSSYDFVYLPIDFNNKCNVGYGFVNMTSPEATLRLYKAFHQQHWEVFNSRKICEVTYARVQGLEALKEHFKNSKFPSEMEHCLPVVFSPPRDGRRQLSEPLAIVGGHKPDDHELMDGQDFLEKCNDICDGDRQDDGVILAGAASINSDNGDDDKDEKICISF